MDPPGVFNNASPITALAIHPATSFTAAVSNGQLIETKINTQMY
jgi:hypothetical protein